MRRSEGEITYDIETESRVCVKCLERKPFIEYHRDNQSPDNVRKICKECVNLTRYQGRKKKTEDDHRYNIQTQTKECTVCKERKPFIEYHNSKVSRDGKQYRCISCDNKARVDYRARNSARNYVMGRIKQLRHKYNITHDELTSMMNEQRGCCAICGHSLTDPSKDWQYAVDHNHKTGEVRGLLCLNCNSMLGQSKDDPVILREGARYLKENGYYGGCNKETEENNG